MYTIVMASVIVELYILCSWVLRNCTKEVDGLLHLSFSHRAIMRAMAASFIYLFIFQKFPEDQGTNYKRSFFHGGELPIPE